MRVFSPKTLCNDSVKVIRHLFYKEHFLLNWHLFFEQGEEDQVLCMDAGPFVHPAAFL
jgi:hypothetical protein